MNDETPIMKCPQWMKDRMEEIKKMPPPTPEEVQSQFDRCRELRREHDLQDLKVLCQKLLDDKLNLDSFLDECQMIYLSNGYDVTYRD